MEETASELSAAIGARVKQERIGRQWTLDVLAEMAGVSRRMLVNVEQGVSNPSVGILLRIGDALGVGLPALVEPPVRSSVKLTRRGEGPSLWRGGAGGVARLVGGTESPDVLELWDWTLGPGDAHNSEAHAHGTKELLQVQEGTVTVTVGGDPFRLDEGDALTFRGDVPHHYANPTQSPARFSLAVFEPDVGGKTSRRPHASQ